MIHFEEEAWFDFVRRLLSRERQALMQQHLDDGCARCSRIYTTWKNVLDIASRESRYERPESINRSVKAAFNIHKRGPLLRRAAIMARQVYDSVLEPLPAGIRSSCRTARRTVFAEGDVLIEVCIDQSENGHLALTGQAQHMAVPQRFAYALAYIVRGDEMVALTTASAFGEFRLTFDDQKSLELYIEAGNDPPLGICLDFA